jgi:hypothetical protein
MSLPRARSVPDWDSGDTLADRFRAHAGDTEHLYGYAMRGMADDWEAGGPTQLVCRGYETAPHGAVIQLRLLAGVFRLVLTGRTPELGPYYPCLGGTDPASHAWPVMREVIAAHIAELHEALTVAPQTNEVGRAAALLAGLFDIVATSGVRRIALLELGASAGLNLLVDRYHFESRDWRFGPADSPVQLIGAIEGPVNLQSFEIVDRAGCDLHPVDAGTATGRLLLRSFVWPFDLHRHERLAAALRVAASQPQVRIDHAAASDWLPRTLGAVSPNALPVVWHSITQLYWPSAELAAVEAILDRYGRMHRLAEVSMEFDLTGPRHAKPEIRTRLWNPDAAHSPRHRRLGTVHDHGIPVTLARAGQPKGDLPRYVA